MTPPLEQLEALLLLGSRAEEKPKSLQKQPGGEPPVCRRVNKSVIKSCHHIARHARFSFELEK